MGGFTVVSVNLVYNFLKSLHLIFNGKVQLCAEFDKDTFFQYWAMSLQFYLLENL